MVLVPRLSAAGYSIVLDATDFVAGATGIGEMERAVIDSRRVLLVLTPEYLASRWGTFENLMAQTLDPDARDRKMIPVLLKDCSLPLRLRMLHYRDLREDEAREWDRLMRDLI
jgi:hypothetical protein